MSYRNRTIRSAALVLALGAPSMAQDVTAQAFHSPHAINLSTANTLSQGDLLIEISHRFFPPVEEGGEALWGLDGPVANRLGLSFGASDHLTLGVLRSNLDDNLEVNLKARVLDLSSRSMSFQLGVMGGIAWNMSPALVAGAEDNESQGYAQAMLNLNVEEMVSVGVVPTYLRNPRIRDTEADDAFVLGLHAQGYLTESVSVLGEWIVSEEREGQAFDSGSFGIELETRGHFFKILVTNQVRMNPTQVLGGAADEFEPAEWRLGFNITRRLAF